MSALRFAALILRDARADRGDIDGGTIQDYATQCGLLLETTVIEPCREEGCRCAEYGEWPTLCYRYSKKMERAIAALDEVKP